MMSTNFKFGFCVLLAAIVGTSGLYDSSPSVIDLNPSNFNKQVMNSDDVWIVEFYAPWCGHCQALVPEYAKASKSLAGVVKVGAVNADEHKSLAGQYGIQGFPSIKIFGKNKNKPVDYTGPRTSQGFVDAAFRTLRSIVDGRLGESGGSGGRNGGDSGSNQGVNKDVIELTDSTFEKTVLQSEDMWLVEFYAPWCGHCKNLAPHWASAATELKGKVKLGALDATVHTVIANKYGVRGFPTIKHFPSGKKSDAEEYDGGRTSADIVQWALEKAAQNIPPPEILQITDESVLTKACEGHQLCIVAVLPHILDCQSSCRNNYLDILKRLGEKFKKNMWGWLWVEAGAQMELEENLGIGGFGYPALAAANIRKMKYSWLRGAFSYDGINEFLRELAVGRGSTAPLKGASLPKVLETEPWDGKDGKLEIEDDDLNDVDLDDDSKKDEL